MAERGEEVTLALVETDVHSGTAVAECLGIISHEGTSWRSHAGGAKDRERGASERERERKLKKEREKEKEREREGGERRGRLCFCLSLSPLIVYVSL